jgi:hypothetical protein
MMSELSENSVIARETLYVHFIELYRPASYLISLGMLLIRELSKYVLRD